MNWLVLVTVAAVAAAVEAAGPRRCAGRLARERLKAAEKIRDKRFYLFCCTASCATQPLRRPRPPPTTRRYQPYHKTWFGLKYGYLEALGSTTSRVSRAAKSAIHDSDKPSLPSHSGYWSGFADKALTPVRLGAIAFLETMFRAAGYGRSVSFHIVPHADDVKC
ncbi:unnamed protein product, partial [Iphiclides podalirius]